MKIKVTQQVSLWKSKWNNIYIWSQKWGWTYTKCGCDDCVIMNPLELPEIVLVVARGCDFNRKSASVFKTFRSVCEVWRYLYVSLSNTNARSCKQSKCTYWKVQRTGICYFVRSDKIRFKYWNEHKKRDVYSYLVGFIIEMCLLDDNKLIRLLRCSWDNGVLCLNGGKIATRTLFDACLEHNQKWV